MLLRRGGRWTRGTVSAALFAVPLLIGLSGCRENPAMHQEGSLPPIADVLQRHTPELLDIRGVIGTGEGADHGRPVFVIFVTSRTPELDARLPRTLEGYRVVVRETGEVTAPPR